MFLLSRGSALGKGQVEMPGTATEHGALPGSPGTQFSQRENRPSLLVISVHTTTGSLVKLIWTPMVSLCNQAQVPRAPELLGYSRTCSRVYFRKSI